MLRSPSRARRTSKWPSALDKRMTHPMALAGMLTSIDSSAQDDAVITVASAKSLGTGNIRDHSPRPSAHNSRDSSASCKRRCKNQCARGDNTWRATLPSCHTQRRSVMTTCRQLACCHTSPSSLFHAVHNTKVHPPAAYRGQPARRHSSA